MLIDRTYFDGPILLTGVNEAHTRAAIDAAIAEYEPEFLLKVMGPSLYAAFITGIAAGTSGFSSGFSSGFGSAGTIAERWEWLRDGHSYTYGGAPYVWPGIKEAIACYVYWQYRSENATQTVSTGGEVAAKHENSVSVGVDRKMVKAWNKMVDWSRSMAHMVYHLRGATDPIYPEFDSYEPDDEVYHYQNIFGI